MEVITGIICPRCKDLLYSLSVHDFRQCRCGTCFIDGGREYTRVGYIPGLAVRWIDIEFRDSEIYLVKLASQTDCDRREQRAYS